MTAAKGVAGAQARPRIEPIGADDWNERIEELHQVVARHPMARKAADGGPAQPGNMFSVLVRHPELYRAWATFTTELRLAQTLSRRDRELVVLRTGWRCQAPYEWGQHVRMALDLGLSHDEIERVVAGPDAPGWTPFDAALVGAAD